MLGPLVSFNSGNILNSPKYYGVAAGNVLGFMFKSSFRFCLYINGEGAGEKQEEDGQEGQINDWDEEGFEDRRKIERKGHRQGRVHKLHIICRDAHCSVLKKLANFLRLRLNIRKRYTEQNSLKV